MAPKYWVNVSQINFDFTAFVEKPGTPEDATMEYWWGVGSNPGHDNVFPFSAFNGSVEVNSPLLHIPFRRK